MNRPGRARGGDRLECGGYIWPKAEVSRDQIAGQVASKSNYTNSNRLCDRATLVDPLYSSPNKCMVSGGFSSCLESSVA